MEDIIIMRCAYPPNLIDDIKAGRKPPILADIASEGLALLFCCEDESTINELSDLRNFSIDPDAKAIVADLDALEAEWKTVCEFIRGTQRTPKRPILWLLQVISALSGLFNDDPNPGSSALYGNIVEAFPNSERPLHCLIVS